MKTTTKQPQTESSFKLEQAFVLWKNTSKKGTEYLKGKDLNGGKILGYFNSNKKNPKEPDIRVYSTSEDGKTDKEIASLWDSESKSKTRYLTGTTDEKEKIVGFYGKSEKAPYISCYFKEDEPEKN